jgi:glycosyltransferase involved in cell wall biosynthesis
MKISIAICTWNRSHLLRQTLSTLKDLAVPNALEWEILVVNNNCTDSTDDVVEGFGDCLPIRLLHERAPGKSHAANLATREARGELMLWTDDDVLVDPGWLAAYVRAANDWPDAGYFGGRISPWFESKPPEWVEANTQFLSCMLVTRDLGPNEGPLGDQAPWGANMAFRTHVLRKVNFSSQFGPTGNNQVRGEEVELVLRLQRERVFGVWVPSAVVRHFVVNERLTPQYLWSFYAGSGRTHARAGTHQLPLDGKRWGGVPRYLYRLYAERRLGAMLSCLRQSSNWVQDYAAAAWVSGIIRELRESKVDGRLAKNSDPDALVSA